MKKIFCLLLLLGAGVSYHGYAQDVPEPIKKEAVQAKPKFGLKLGYNVAKLTGATANFTPRAGNGFNLSAFYGTPSKGLGYRTEIVFSRQGFSFDGSGKPQSVSQDYLYMPHFTTLTVAKRVQLQACGQIGYPLNAKQKEAATEEDKWMNYLNRIDYGAALGFEVYPYKGLIIGGRYNVSLGNAYKQTNGSAPSASSVIGSFLPINPADFKGRNAVMQFFVGYHF